MNMSDRDSHHQRDREATMGKDKIAQKLAKLIRHRDSAEAIGNAAEASVFAGKIQELLTRHELTMSEVEYAAVQTEDPLGVKWADVKATSTRVAWQETLAHHIAKTFFCRIMVQPGSSRIAFVGRGTHREAAEYVFVRLSADLLRLQEIEYGKVWKKGKAEGLPLWRGFKAAFRNEFVATVAERLAEQRKADEKRAKAEAGDTGTALIRLDNADKQVTRFMREELHTRSAGRVRGQRSGNSEGRAAGRLHGERANLSANGVGGGEGGRKALGGGR